LQLVVCWVLAKRSHDFAKFICCDAAATVSIELVERFLEFGLLLRI